MSSSRVVAGAVGATGAASTGVEETTGAGAEASTLGAAALRVAFLAGVASTTTGAGEGTGAGASTAAAFLATRGVFAGVAVFIVPEDEVLEDILLRTDDSFVKYRINFFIKNQFILEKKVNLFFFFEILIYS